MPAKPEGVYSDRAGHWYFKVNLGRDLLTGRRQQLTRRGFLTATAAAKARREALSKVDSGLLAPTSNALTINELLDLYLDGIDADDKLSPKTRHDYREKADAYLRPLLGNLKVRDLKPETILAWQRKLLAEPRGKRQRPLAPNTIRLARAPLAGAFKLAAASGIVAVNPIVNTSRPTPKRSIPKHWSPEEARSFLGLMEGDRTFPLWAFLMGSGLRVSEVVALRWPNVDLEQGIVRVVEFATVVGNEVLASSGKSRDAVRSVDIDDELVRVLRLQSALQERERLAARSYQESTFVFTNPDGDRYHPQHISKLLAKTTLELGLPRLSAHGLRHTCATLMLASGVPPKVAAERLGHADPTLFLNLYSHVTPTMQRDAADKIGKALFGAR